MNELRVKRDVSYPLERPKSGGPSTHRDGGGAGEGPGLTAGGIEWLLVKPVVRNLVGKLGPSWFRTWMWWRVGRLVVLWDVLVRFRCISHFTLIVPFMPSWAWPATVQR